jgi:HD-GYP domain-containing protein (c-di-GMP phosphodiesterase class II)
MGATEELKRLTAELDRLALKLWGDMDQKEGRTYTSLHMYRVSEYVAGMADILDIGRRTKALLVCGAKLHDAGKMYVGNEIVLADRMPEKERMEEKERHVHYGLRWLRENATASVPKEIRDAVLYHHESWDGTGAPEGRKGAKIPYAARVVRTADIWDVIFNGKNYKPPMGSEIAVRYIKGCSGNKLEPTMVSVLLTYLGL